MRRCNILLAACILVMCLLAAGLVGQRNENAAIKTELVQTQAKLEQMRTNSRNMACLAALVVRDTKDPATLAAFRKMGYPGLERE